MLAPAFSAGRTPGSRWTRSSPPLRSRESWLFPFTDGTHDIETKGLVQRIRRENFFRPTESFAPARSSWREMTRPHQRSRLMKRTLVRYKAAPDKAQENERLIGKIFEELKTKAPEGV